MNLKELIKEVERLMDNYKLGSKNEYPAITPLPEQIIGIKQTVEAVDVWFKIKDMSAFELGQQGMKDWQTLKKLLGIK